MPSIVLRPYQQALLDRWKTLPKPRRLFLAWDMGAGKTLAALSVVAASKSINVLIVCPAVVRPMWHRAVWQHPYFLGRSVGVVEHGTERKLSRAKTVARDVAHAAQIQIVSYDLVGAARATGFDFIIIDEFHALRSVSSKQSQSVRAVFAANPQAQALALSGTPIPNEAKQLWNPVDTLFPGQWGTNSRKGFEPWAFVNRYCKKEANEYGTRFYGLREERAQELADRFARISDRVVQADFADYLPPVYVEPLEVGANARPLAVAKDWLKSFGAEANHVGIYCHLRETARAIHAANPGSLYIDGTLSASERDETLRVAAQCHASLIVGTTHALQEGISLSFQKAALVIEWTSDVANVIQFLGRFGRQDSTSMAPTRIDIAMGPNDISAAQTISERVESINSIIRESRSSRMAANAFAPQELSDAAFEEQLQSMAVQLEKRTSLWFAEDDDDVDKS